MITNSKIFKVFYNSIIKIIIMIKQMIKILFVLYQDWTLIPIIILTIFRLFKNFLIINLINIHINFVLFYKTFLQD